jgi:hypothetical protein
MYLLLEVACRQYEAAWHPHMLCRLIHRIPYSIVKHHVHKMFFPEYEMA